jgi:molybdopterin molybdotransferase
VISVEEHLDRVLATVRPLEPIELRLMDAHGCVLAEDVVASQPLPLFDNSAMDGYALRAEDVATATPDAPVTLHVLADIAAGSAPLLAVGPGTCARVMTGAPLPRGADTVVPQEWTDGGLAQVSVRHAARPGDYVRRTGEDVASGTLVLPSGTPLAAPQVALLAALGRRNVLATPRPRVVVISTGNELVEPGSPLQPGQVPDANGYALAAAVREAGGVAYQAGIVPDDSRRLIDTIEDHLIQADVVITTGGVSVGAHDVVKDVLGRIGDVRFDRVAMQPGMPQAFGTVGPDRTPVFGLPGNPVSAVVSFEVFVRPALRRLVGAQHLGRPQVAAVLAAPVESPPGKRQYLRVAVTHQDGRWVATPTSGSGSHLVSGLARANALAVVGEDTTALPAGASVTCWLLERRGV